MIITVTETCLFPECTAVLGQESRDLGFPFCHEHRKCALCEEKLNPRECMAVIKESTESGLLLSDDKVLHPRCSSLSRKSADDDPTVVVKQSYIDYINNIRLMIEPDITLTQDTNQRTAELFVGKIVANMSFEEKCMFLRKMEAATAHTSILVRKDPAGRRIKDQLEQLERRNRATEEQAKVKATSKAAKAEKEETDPVEILIAEFMRANQIADRKTGLKIWRDRYKAIQGLVEGAKLSEADATQIVDTNLIKQGLMKAPAVK